MEEIIKNFDIASMVVFKDNQLIAFNKPVGLASIKDNDNEKSLHELAEIYCQKNLFIVNRLDRPASGVVLFTKNKKALAFLNKQFSSRSVVKEYYAWVKGVPESQAKLVDFLIRNGKTKKAFVSSEKNPKAKKAILEYSTIHKLDHYTLLKVLLHTGRFHQIRAQLSHRGHPIYGDQKYGAKRGNLDRSIALHARSLNFEHPTKATKITIEAPLPPGPLWKTLEETT